MKKEFNSQFIEYNASGDGFVKISPVGEKVEGVDGRCYKIDAPLVIKNTQKLKGDLLLDLNHSDGEAMGWFDINSLEAREDGIYAKLELTEIGQNHIAKRLYRYLSPTYITDGSKNGVLEVALIASVGLVNRPNLLEKALNFLFFSKEKNTQGEKMDENERLLKENGELKTQITELKEQLKALKNELESFAKSSKNSQIDTMIKNGELLLKHKNVALGLDGEAYNAYIEVAKNETALTLNRPNIELSEDKNSMDDNVFKLLGIKE